MAWHDVITLCVCLCDYSMYQSYILKNVFDDMDVIEVYGRVGGLPNLTHRISRLRLPKW